RTLPSYFEPRLGKLVFSRVFVSCARMTSSATMVLLLLVLESSVDDGPAPAQVVAQVEGGIDLGGGQAGGHLGVTAHALAERGRARRAQRRGGRQGVLLHQLVGRLAGHAAADQRQHRPLAEEERSEE